MDGAGAGLVSGCVVVSVAYLVFFLGAIDLLIINDNLL